MRSALVLLAAVVGPPWLVVAGTQHVWWNITYVEQVNPDGLAPRRVVGVNNTWPPPPLDVNTTDSLVVHVTNSLDEPTTIHHHGMFFNHSSWMDGALGVSECGIPPGGSFDYLVPIGSSNQWGTYWIHGHAQGQYVDGLRAPLVLHPPKEPYLYDEEFTVILGDWYHEEHHVLLEQFINTDNPEGNEPVPDSGLMYFSQNGAYLAAKPGSFPDPESGVISAVGFNDNATLPFEPGKTYRLRVINTSAFAMFFFWIDGHEMSIIEVDGTDIEKEPVDYLSLTVAQRYSVLVTARNDTSSNWAIHANMNTDEFDEVPDTLNPNITSLITYSNAPSTPFTNLGPNPPLSYTPLPDHTFAPLIPIPAPTPSRTITLVASFDIMSDGTNRGMFNDMTYSSPLVPALFSAMSLGENTTTPGAYGPSSFVLEHMEVVDLVVVNTDDGMHPFHIHGHTMMLVGREDDYLHSSIAASGLDPPASVNLSNPMRRDTVHIPGGGSVTLRIVADNPGAWMFHCHMEWHLQSGLAIQLIEAPLELDSSKADVPKDMYDNCKALGKPHQGNAAGHQSTTDLSGWELGPWKRNSTTAIFTTPFTTMGRPGWQGKLDKWEESLQRWAEDWIEGWNKWLQECQQWFEDWDIYFDELDRRLQRWSDGLEHRLGIDRLQRQLDEYNTRMQEWSDNVEESLEAWLEGLGQKTWAWVVRRIGISGFILSAVILSSSIATAIVWRRSAEKGEVQAMDIDLEKLVQDSTEKEEEKE